MKINADKLTVQSAANFSIYLICGDEPLFIKETKDTLLAQLQTPEMEHLRFYGKETPWKQIPAYCHNGSLLATSRIIDIQLDTPKLPTDAAKILVELLQQPLLNTKVLISCPRIDSQAQRAKWVTTIDKIGLIIQVWPLTPKQFPFWLTKRARDYKVELTPAAKQLIAEYCAGNLLAANQALQKLSLINHLKTCGVTEIQHVLSDSSQHDIYTWIDACIAGNHSQQCKILQQLQHLRFEPTFILWNIAREIRQLFELKQLLPHSESMAKLLKSKRILTKKHTNYQSILTQVDTTFWCELLMAITIVDQSIKGLLPNISCWQALSKLGSALSLRNTRMIYDN